MQLILTGIPGGGTSVVAGLLRIMDIHMGGEQIANETNEDKKFNVAVTKPEELPELIEKRDSNHDKWGFKNPHIMRLLDEPQKYFSNPRFILVFRDAFTVADRPELIKQKLDRYKEFVDFIDNNQEIAKGISYEKLLINKEEQIKEIAEFVEENITDKQLEKCKQYIDPYGYKKVP